VYILRKMKNKENKTQGLVNILFGILKTTIEALFTMDEFKKLSHEVMTDVIYEFLIFNLHQFNRTFLCWFGVEERDELMDAVVDAVQKHLVYYSSKAMREADNNLAIDTLGEYLQGEYCNSKANDFISLYNDGEMAYGQYKDNPEEGKGLAGTLIWEFGNKIVNIIGRSKDVCLIMKIQHIGISFTYFADEMERVLKE